MVEGGSSIGAVSPVDGRLGAGCTWFGLVIASVRWRRKSCSRNSRLRGTEHRFERTLREPRAQYRATKRADAVGQLLVGDRGVQTASLAGLLHGRHPTPRTLRTNGPRLPVGSAPARHRGAC